VTLSWGPSPGGGGRLVRSLGGQSMAIADGIPPGRLRFRYFDAEGSELVPRGTASPRCTQAGAALGLSSPSSPDRGAGGLHRLRCGLRSTCRWRGRDRVSRRSRPPELPDRAAALATATPRPLAHAQRALGRNAPRRPVHHRAGLFHALA
jgi:hypothetical protein